MNDQVYEGATPEQLRHPMVREFLAVHDMFRNELAVMLRFINELLNGDFSLESPETRNRVQTLIRVGSRYTQTLHMHHHIETSTLFPMLAPEGLENAVIERLNADHDDISAMIDGFNEGIQNLAVIQPEVFDSDLRRLADALHNHLAYEETHVCPLLTHFSRWPIQH